MAQDRKPRPRSSGAAAGFGKPRGPRPARFGAEDRAGKPPRFRSEGGAARPPSRFRSEGGAARPPSRFRAEDRPPRPPRFRGEERGGAEGGDARDPYRHAQRPPRAREEGGHGFTVTLDPDVARVFRGDASVNKALRLVLQLMQVVQGPPKTFGDRPRPARAGYQGSDEARGFTRKPRFDADDEGETKE